ncbi:MAG: serine/threonine protein kinase [Blastocatellia bacterium]|nr:serine/threonine protein kinase [Blastocatellia bacterium]
MRNEVESLLASDESSGDFIENPALEVAAELLADDKSNSKIGQVIGQYKIVSLLGAGGMGEVWLADDAKLKRRIALKLLADVQNQDRLLRFEQEAFAVSALNHPNIITIFDIGESDGQQFIATEYIEGKTLRQLIQEGNLTISQGVDIGSQVCAALSTAHSAGIIHRDIKPENIMVRSDGIVKVLDFGLARFSETSDSNPEIKFITKPGMVMGTINYMSPEQARALPVDEKTDVFSLGIVLYEMLARELPFKGVNEVETLAAILEREPKPLSELLPENLRDLIFKSLSKNHLDRPKASEMLNELRLVKRDLDFNLEFRRQKTTDNLNEEKTIEMTAVTDQNALAGVTGGIIQTKKTSYRPLFSAF